MAVALQLCTSVLPDLERQGQKHVLESVIHILQLFGIEFLDMLPLDAAASHLVPSMNDELAIFGRLDPLDASVDRLKFRHQFLKPVRFGLIGGRVTSPACNEKARQNCRKNATGNPSSHNPGSTR